MGGYIGLSHLINSNAENCQFLITLATKLNWNQTIASEENAKLNLQQLAPILSKLGSKDKMNSEQEVLAFQSEANVIQFQIIDQQHHLLERMDAMVISDCIQQILKTKIN